MTKVERIKDWALNQYAENYGASCIVECFTDEEIDEFKSLDDAKEYCALLHDQYEDIKNA